ncbi:hypothetical protein TrVFT333_003502 [Trichoderma virens FT-333]|nr:hypothetical protein TrVFT333_003502 [Trichoderma virens FT-333]
MTDSDVLLRLKTSCATTYDHYDQVVAVSQKIINDAFVGLYDENPEFAKISFSDRRVGSIEGDLLSPHLLLGGREGGGINLATVLYVMRFKSGKLIIYGATEEDDFEDDLDGWKLAVKVDLDKQFVKVDPTADPAEQERQQKIWDFIHNKFSIPGDYSISRLYAKLSDVTWKDYDYDASQFGHNSDGTPRSWAQLIKQYPDLEIGLPLFLGKWAQQQEDESMTMAGIKLMGEPPEENDPKESTFEPTAMIHQVFGYQNPAKGVPEPVVSYDVPGNLNSLLYCEMVEDNPLPQDSKLASRGIFTTQPSSTTPRIDGSFVLSHQLFLEKFLLPMLNAFNMATIIYPDSSRFSYSGTSSTVSWNYAIGLDKNHPNPGDSFYSFKPIYNPGSPQDVTAYKFTWEHSDTLTPKGYNPNSKVWGGFTAIGSSEVDFKWEPGTNSFRVTGLSEYKYDGEWADNEGMRYPFGWLRITSVISSQVRTLKANLAEAFQTTGQLTYPGYGTFDFSAPTIGNTGEVLATIAFKNVTGKIEVPPPQSLTLRPPESVPFLAVPFSAPCVAPIAKLSWSFTKPVKGSSESVEILINGKNNTDKAISLVSIAFTLSSQPSGQGLVTSTEFKADKWTIGEPDETKHDIFQIVVDTDGTPAFTDVAADVGEDKPPGITPITFSGTGDVSIEPGNTLTLALWTGTGFPNTYPVSIVEGWPKKKERACHSLRKAVNVILSPP